MPGMTIETYKAGRNVRMSFRYIGSKARIVEAIIEHVGQPDGGVFVDAFSGTGAVAQAASRAGWKVHVNDHLASSAIMSFARLSSQADIPFVGLSSYRNAIVALNHAPPRQGFIWAQYSPASSDHCAVSRMYFTEDNAQKIDGIRHQILQWHEQGVITPHEQQVLIADLMRAANRIANTAGTYALLDPLLLICRNGLMPHRFAYPHGVSKKHQNKSRQHRDVKQQSRREDCHSHQAKILIWDKVTQHKSAKSDH